MSNLNKYNQAFADVFGVSKDTLNDNFSKDTESSWDSVHQLGVVTALEDAFDIMMDPEDIMALVSYKAGKELLKKYDIEL